MASIEELPEVSKAAATRKRSLVGASWIKCPQRIEREQPGRDVPTHQGFFLGNPGSLTPVPGIETPPVLINPRTSDGRKLVIR